jgi:hypothetical protein
MAFEDGVFTELREERPKDSHQIPTMFLVEDISQYNDAPLPFFETALLLDFSDDKSWPAVRTVMKSINPAIPIDSGFLKESNRLRLENLAIFRFTCPKKDCQSTYETLVWMGPTIPRRVGIPDPPRHFAMNNRPFPSSMSIAATWSKLDLGGHSCLDRSTMPQQLTI